MRAEGDALRALKDVRGMGKSIMDDVQSIIETRTAPRLESLRKILAPSKALCGVWGVGPSSAAKLLALGVCERAYLTVYAHHTIEGLPVYSSAIGGANPAIKTCTGSL